MLQETPLCKVQRKRSFGYGGTQSNCFPLNFKHPKVDAVRDFPTDCGTFSPGVTTSLSKVGSGEAAPLVLEVQMVDATRKSPVDCGSIPTGVIRSQTSQARRVDKIREFLGDCGSFPTQVVESPRRAKSDEAANRMSKEGQEEALVPEKILEVISPINDSSAKHVCDDGSGSFKTLDEPKLDNKHDDKFALVEANKGSAIMKTISRPRPVQLYPPPKIRKSYYAVRDFPPGCGPLPHASWSKDKPEEPDSKEIPGEVICTETQVQRLSDSLTQVTATKTEEDMVDRPEQLHEQLFDEDDPEEEKCIQVQGSSGVELVPGDVVRRALSPSQKKWSPHSAPQVVNFIGKRKKKQLPTDAFKPTSQKQMSFTKSAEDARRPKGDKPAYQKQTSFTKSADYKDNTADRYKVKEALNHFRVIFEKISDEPEPQPKENMKTVRNIHVETATVLKNQQRWVNTTKLLGPVPGIEVGDQFRFRAELVVVGLHRQYQAGIDYMTKDGVIFATSIVDSGRYANEAESSDVLVYSGAGGNPSLATNKKPGDQKLERGNIALKNSMDSQMPVRVIRGRQTQKSSNNREWTPIYMYDGLYNVTSYKQEIGRYGKLVFMFKLHRLPGQPKINWGTVKGSKVSKVCKIGNMVDDISQGKEKMPIRVINTLDNEKPFRFHYITKLFCLKPHNRSLPVGCDCTDGCSEMKSCICSLKNGGKIPFNDSGALVPDKPLVYECGPSCKCPPSCKNRVSQNGIRYQLEVFKTKLMGFGVRSRNYISAGTFICEYVGELLQDKDAELRRYDDYLFDVGCGRENLEVSSDNGYTIDAAHCGNVGRFLNHSCSPNLYAVNVLYDHHNTMYPHVMFFAASNIPPLRELTFDYNYKLDTIRDEDGNIKKKNCYCGSLHCRGRLY